MIASHPLLARTPAQPQPMLPLLRKLPEIALAQARLHEACGPARHTFALWLARQTEGPVLWIAPDWVRDTLNCDGVRAWMDPARLVFIHPRRSEDLLWVLEEVLRAGAVDLCVLDLPGFPTLTQVRRAHLAAETGAAAGNRTPTGLLLTPGEGGSPGVETRWHMAQRHSAHDTAWRLERRRARTAPPKTWQIHMPAPGAEPQLKSA